MKVRGQTLTILDQVGADFANDNTLAARSDWQVGDTDDVFGKPLTDDIVELKAGDLFYCLYRIDGQRLQISIDKNGRPKDLDNAVEFTRL